MPVVKHAAPLIGALVALILIILGVLAVAPFGGRSGKDDGLARALSEEFASIPVSDDELFLPTEPDYLGAVVLAREKRKAWTAAEAEAFWTDPATLGLSSLAADAAAVIDAIMENAP